MHRSLLLCCAALLCGACITTRAPDSTPFAHINALQNLAGVYQNRGEVGSGAPQVYLSAVIWPADSTLHHEQITCIEVTVAGQDTLTVRALSVDGVEKEGSFAAGSDFELSAGRIRLKHEAGFAGFKVGEPLLGP